MDWLKDKKLYQIFRDFSVDHFIIEFSEYGSDLSHPVGAIVEKENSIAL